ncbi:MAG TPA: type VI secretion system-associated protein TagF [Limnobacter sp.]|uniref:type VI secretion system-associated protein TagF n=1 Tax=Limnobacter sp. TaxID=2003368 RepID=UPI002EDAAFDE
MIRRMCLGKIPGLGDFVSRGVPSAMATDWYDRLSLWMHQGEAQHGADWPSVFMSACALGFNTIDSAAPGGRGFGLWLGVVLPSVDKVGRLFPWLVLEHHAAPLVACHLPLHLQQCFDTGVAAIRDDWSAQQLDALFSRSTQGDGDQDWACRPMTLWTLDQGQQPRVLRMVDSFGDVAWP